MSDLIEINDRALRAGATPPLEHVGSGSTADVFCDARGLAYKVGRFIYPLEDEAEWLALASREPDLQAIVPQFVAWDPDLGVLVRECVKAAWRHGRVKLPDEDVALRVWKRIGAAMAKHGWTAPESSRSNFVCPDWECAEPVLVDSGFAYRIGLNLEEWVRTVVEAGDPGRIRHAAVEVLHSRLDRYVEPARAAALQRILEGAGAPTEEEIARGA